MEVRGLRGVRVAREAPVVSHLLFADYCNIFSGDSEQEVDVVSDIMVMYELASEQKVNLEKTDVSFSSGVVEYRRKSLADRLGVRLVESHANIWGCLLWWVVRTG